jgi:3',5'-cyclic AMP phosphodiesterase CpdA
MRNTLDTIFFSLRRMAMAGLAAIAALYPWAGRAEIPAGWPGEINRLIYPTIGRPLIIRPGDSFTLEFDCIGDGAGGSQPAVSVWNVSLASSNDQWATETDCVVWSALTGVSESWPGDSTADYWSGSGPWAGREVWRVTVGVPLGTRADLYDLYASAWDGETIADDQPHAVQVIDEFKDNYTFIQISDFHINDPRGPSVILDLPGPHPRSQEFIGYQYIKKAIDEVNRINPDFVIITGDLVFGVPFFVEYPYASTGVTDYTGDHPDWNGEYAQAYQHLLRFEVPVVCLPGNHDSYNLETAEGDPLEGHFRQDGAEIWPTMFSPRYFDWNYGDKCHFTCFWSYDKAPIDRTFSDWSVLIPEAQFPPMDGGGGQVRWNAGGLPPAWNDQMSWIEQDLTAAQGNFSLLAMACHNPFYGTYSNSDSFTDLTSRNKLQELSRTYGVGMALSGHTHLDHVFTDTTGGADILHVNTTTTSFNTSEYPGFRQITVESGAVASYYYLAPDFSCPSYENTILAKHSTVTDAFNAMTRLETPSVAAWFSSTNPAAVHKEFECWNHLTEGEPPVSLDNTVADFVMPDLGEVGSYLVTGGSLLQYWRPAPGYLTLQVRADGIPPGGMGLITVEAPVPGAEHLVLQSGDYDGDGKSDIAVFRSGNGRWSVRGLGNVYFGTAGDIPASGDYDGDGHAEIAVFRPGNGLWAVREVTRFFFGGSDSVSAPADYDGDGSCDASVFSGGVGLWSARGITAAFFGQTGDLPVPADYNADGRTEFAVFRPSSALWAVYGGGRYYFGQNGDAPVPGAYCWPGDASRTAPLAEYPAVFRPMNGLWAVLGHTRLYFGMDGDSPVPGAFGGGIVDDFAVFRGSSGMWGVRDQTRCFFGTAGDLPATR